MAATKTKKKKAALPKKGAKANPFAKTAKSGSKKKAGPPTKAQAAKGGRKSSTKRKKKSSK